MGEGDYFSVDPALKVPFSGGPGTKLDRARLRLIKDEIRENPAVSRRYLKTLSEQFVPGMRSEIDKLPPRTQLIVMPSTTGRNVVPALLAAHVKKHRPDVEILNAKSDLIKVAHRQESKMKGEYMIRAEDPRRYSFNEKKLTALSKSDKPFYIIDDSISTGESAFVLQRQLSKRGVYAQGVVAAVAGNKYFSYASDMKRVYDKATADYPEYYSPAQIRKDVYTQFAGFPRKKIADFEWAIGSADPVQRNHALLYLRESSEYFRQEQIDPQSALTRTPVKFQQRDVRSQLRLDYPDLNDNQIDRYVKLQQKQTTKIGVGADQGQDVDF